MKRTTSHPAIRQMKRVTRNSPTDPIDLKKDCDFLSRSDVTAFVWLVRPTGTHLFPVDLVGHRERWRTVLYALVTHYTDRGEGFTCSIYQCGKLRPASLRKCVGFLHAHNGNGR